MRPPPDTVRSTRVLGLGKWSGRALEKMHRSKNSAKESCVAIPANVAGIVLLVLLESVHHEGLHATEVGPSAERGVW